MGEDTSNSSPVTGRQSESEVTRQSTYAVFAAPIEDRPTLLAVVPRSLVTIAPGFAYVEREDSSSATPSLIDVRS